MIFDSPEMLRLREKYRGYTDYRSPEIIILDRQAHLSGEREYLESLIESVRPQKQKEWLSRLWNDDNGQHLSAWFEMMLYGWLRKVGEVDVEPEIEGNFPDFAVHFEDKKIIIEAVSWLIPENERRLEHLKSEFVDKLNELPFPYLIEIEKLEINSSLDCSKIIDQIVGWLEHQPDRIYEYNDNYQNHVELKASLFPSLTDTATVGPTVSLLLNPDLLKSPLRKKARQHRNVRVAGYPYVIAIFIESPFFSHDEIVDAWFGQEQVVVDMQSKKIVETRLDLRGLYYWKRKIHHKTVSGTLVFKTQYRPSLPGKPYSHQPIRTCKKHLFVLKLPKENSSNNESLHL
jgi:hypothetical protein